MATSAPSDPADPPGTRQLAFELGHTPSLAEADFVVGEGNRMALAHLLAFATWPGPLTLIIGPPKSGKSHLARIFADRSTAQFAQPEQLVSLAQAGGTAPLVVEDVDTRFYDEVALFNLLNQSMRDRRPVLLTARTPVADWHYRTQDLRSRARLAATFTVAASDDIQLSQMFVKLFGDRQIAVDPKVIAYIVARMERSPEEAVLLVERLDRAALQRGTAITRLIAAQVLAERRAETGWEGDHLDMEGEDDE